MVMPTEEAIDNDILSETFGFGVPKTTEVCGAMKHVVIVIPRKVEEVIKYMHRTIYN